ncbi:MAG: DNA-binding protein [Betaproteobacteria bacterium]|nr:DNA-binding protein [Betaproteobacteria bacterium]
MEDSGLARLWRLSGVTLLTSRYAVAEAERNLDSDAQRERLGVLALGTTLIDAPEHAVLPEGIELVAKDAPILLAAIEARATHLLTGDRAHFGALYGRKVSGVKVIPPAAYFKQR